MLYKYAMEAREDIDNDTWIDLVYPPPKFMYNHNDSSLVRTQKTLVENSV